VHPANKFVMRVRRLIVFIVPVAGAVALGAYLLWDSRCPFQCRFVSAEPIVMVDDTGTGFSLVTLSLSNLRSAGLQPASEPARVRAKIGDRWVAVENYYGLGNKNGYLYPRARKELILAIPPGAEACRLSFSYRVEPIKSQLLRKFHDITPVYPRFHYWFWYWRFLKSKAGSLPTWLDEPPSGQARWQQTTVEVALPHAVGPI
jgi:hypothetical protein